ncbi:FadR/GntR family transcriptional regulator [Phenylobacterium montanum]|uniref:FadR family transcriptional regulator n=1 Tax=Phenylobacterium montanum TaxID=2823693 RepID=A0A975IWW8_9CAUL|nr:FadR/GntR family transcriptional regulator [Caulobacter sp. S6]QUD90333.1 FadR family transcriptional regulator [Caulobacter sp. S6]
MADDVFEQGRRGGSLTYDLAESVGRSIIAGEFRDGFPTEGELAKRLGVSRNIIREVVKILSAKGLLSARPRQGTVIEPESRWNLLDPDVLRWLLNREFSVDLLIAFAEARLAFEPHAAAMAARRADAAGRAAITKAIDGMRTSITGHGDRIAADVAFHVAVLEASGNPFFRELRELVNTALRVSMRHTYRIKDPAITLGQHEQTAEAILAGDAEGAYLGMQRMMLDVLSLLPQSAGEPAHQSRTTRRRSAAAS